MRLDSLPASYKAPKKLSIGTNTLEDVTALITFKGFTPILVGDGERPRIWINVPTNKEGTEWYPLVKDNFSTNRKVVVKESSHAVTVSTPEGVAVEAEKAADGSIIVKQLDLRPFGLSVVADYEKLVIMTNTFTSSGFKNVRVMVGIGDA